MEQESKKCFKCGEVKPLSEFYAHPQMADGHLNKCKDCTRADTAKHKKNNPLNVYRTRLKTCLKNPSGVRARKVIEAALEAGVIERPEFCSGCGCSNKEHRIEAHHYDYSKPLDVIWLCTPCHRRMDAQRRTHEGKKPYGRSRD